ncbi:MAG: hypothetical protein ACK4UL_06485, partial [Novosphingobium meiothermophilum]
KVFGARARAGLSDSGQTGQAAAALVGTDRYWFNTCFNAAFTRRSLPSINRDLAREVGHDWRDLLL